MEQENLMGKALVKQEGETTLVLMDIMDGQVLFRFITPVFSKNDLETTLSVTVIIAGVEALNFESRLNVYSNSSREAIARQLSSAFGKHIPWVLVLSRACTSFSKAFREQQAAKILSKDNIEIRPTSLLIEPFLEEKSPNIIFGRGGSGKTFLALRQAMSLASGSEFLGQLPTKKARTLFVDYENSKETFAERIEKMAPFCPGFTPEHEKDLFYFSPDGTPLYEIKEIVARTIKDKEIGLVIIDSAALACGGAPEEAQNAIRFFNALNNLEVTTLTIAHESKADNGNYVFGSVFFHNSARNIWNVRVDNEQEEDVIHVGLLHRKCNNGRLRSPRAARIWFGDKGIDVNYENPSDRFGDELGLKKRIVYLLNDGPKKLQDLCDELDAGNKNVVKSRLTELHRKGVIERDEEGTWKKVTEEKMASPSEEQGNIEDLFG